MSPDARRAVTAATNDHADSPTCRYPNGFPTPEAGGSCTAQAGFATWRAIQSDNRSRDAPRWPSDGGMELSWLDPDNLDRHDIAGAVALMEAANAVDAPHEFAHTVSSFTAH